MTGRGTKPQRPREGRGDLLPLALSLRLPQLCPASSCTPPNTARHPYPAFLSPPPSAYGSQEPREGSQVWVLWVAWDAWGP